jgi:hypothetical protein
VETYDDDDDEEEEEGEQKKNILKIQFLCEAKYFIINNTQIIHQIKHSTYFTI